TLLEAWASQKSFQPKDPEDRQGDGSDFRGQKRNKGICKKWLNDSCQASLGGHPLCAFTG
ncbi:IS5/IS1182 family transposase, partial [Acidithiobacillus sp. IBUN Pt1247-S3]